MKMTPSITAKVEKADNLLYITEHYGLTPRDLIIGNTPHQINWDRHLKMLNTAVEELFGLKYRTRNASPPYAYGCDQEPHVEGRTRITRNITYKRELVRDDFSWVLALPKIQEDIYELE